MPALDVLEDSRITAEYTESTIPHLSSPHAKHYIGYAMKAYIKNLITVINCISSEYTTIFTKVSCFLHDIYSTNKKRSLSMKSVHIFLTGPSAASQVIDNVQQYVLRHVRK